ncbi:hypothetical protein AMECASPLE_031089 [Ameca splendens]|uniref:Uncharacterized protein n=1 Tax=Ameca splendens TaxID=208324 RepID=A0ABV0ZT88_9TELE
MRALTRQGSIVHTGSVCEGESICSGLTSEENILDRKAKFKLTREKPLKAKGIMGRVLLKDQELPHEPGMWKDAADLQCCCILWNVYPCMDVIKPGASRPSRLLCEL